MINSNLVTLNNPTSTTSEFFKVLRSNVQFALDKKENAVMVTSAMPGDGKSFTAANLAVTLAQSGNKTVLIDLDTRKGTVHKIFNIKNQIGMTDLMQVTNIEDEEKYIDQMIERVVPMDLDNLYVIPSGHYSKNASELILKKNLDQIIKFLKEEFDYVIVDTPPLNLVVDPSIIAKKVDSCFLVASIGKTNINSLKNAKKIIDKSKVKFLGMVCNKVPIEKKSYYGKGYAYSYEYVDDSLESKNGKRRKGR